MSGIAGNKGAVAIRMVIISLNSIYLLLLPEQFQEMAGHCFLFGQICQFFVIA